MSEASSFFDCFGSGCRDSAGRYAAQCRGERRTGTYFEDGGEEVGGQAVAEQALDVCSGDLEVDQGLERLGEADPRQPEQLRLRTTVSIDSPCWATGRTQSSFSWASSSSMSLLAFCIAVSS